MKSIKKTRSQFETRVFLFCGRNFRALNDNNGCKVSSHHGRTFPTAPARRYSGKYTSISCMVTTGAFRNTSPNTGIRRDIELFNIYDLSTNEAYLF